MGAITTITRVLLAAASLGAAASLAHAVGSRDAGDGHAIVVTESSGDVAITANGRAHTAGAGSTLALPSRIATGADGYVALAQDATRISIAPESDVEIPADAAEGHLVARLVQHSGNVFYDVQKRAAGRLRVETPFLVAVIKGTQFNVAVQDGSTTISLFEGRLEIRTPDNGEIIQLNAGEIAIRSLIDDSIRVIGMNDQALAFPAVNDAGSVAAARAAVAAAATLVTGSAEIGSAAAPDLRSGAAASPALNVRNTSDLRASALSVDASRTIDGGGSADIGAPTSLAPATSLAASVDLGATTLDAATLGATTLGAATLGATTLDTAVDTTLDAGVDLGGSTLAVDADLGADASLGGATVGAGLDTSLDLGGTAPALDVGLDVDVGLADTGLDTSIDAAVDLGAGSVDASLGLGDTSIDVGLAPDTGLDIDVDTGIDIVDDVTDGLLGDGLLGGGGGSDANDSGDAGGGLGGLLGGLL